MFYEGSEGDTIRLHKQNTVKTVDLLCDKKGDGHINIDLDSEKLESKSGITSYAEIKAYVFDKYGLKVSSHYFGQIRDKAGIKERRNYHTGSRIGRVPNFPLDNEDAIMEDFRHFILI